MTNASETAEWLREFAEAMEAKPGYWHQDFEIYNENHGWLATTQATLLSALAHGYPHYLRRKPRRITISGPGGTYSYPEPMQVRPRYDDVVLAVDFSEPGGVDRVVWTGGEFDEAQYQNGVIHATIDAAHEHAEALIRAMGGTP